MKKSILVLFAVLPVLLFAQNPDKKEKRFRPFFNFTYNLQNMQSPHTLYVYPNNKTYSNFFGAEFGFSISPKKENGLYFNYSNKLDAELGVREIYYLFNSDKGDLITDYNLSSGFFGSLDIGKQYFSNENTQFIVGVKIADKYISGMDPLFFNEEMSEYEGFHFTPGIFGKLNTKLTEKLSLSVKAGLSQSVLNFWRFADNGNDFNFKHPLFADFSVTFNHKSGFNFKTENNLMIPYKDISSYYRISFGIGYRF